MADMSQYLTQKYTKMIGEMAADLSNLSDELVAVKDILRALKNPDLWLGGGEVTLDRVQIMENGDVRILPVPPTPPITETCIHEPKSNGKKDIKELANVS